MLNKKEASKNLLPFFNVFYIAFSLFYEMRVFPYPQ